MDVQGFKDTAATILNNLSDQGIVSNSLADLTNAFAEAIQNKADADAKVEDLTKKNTKLKEDNLALFLKVDVSGTKGQSQQGNPPPKDEHRIEDLFTNGRLIIK